MRNVPVWPLVLVVSAACASSGRTVVQTPAVVVAHDLSHENVEFPRYDQIIWRLQRDGRVSKAAAASFAEAPTAPRTAALLAEANQPDEALQVLGEIVDRYPERIAQAFELLTPHLRRFDDQLRPDRRERLQHIVLAAQRQASKLPREDAARAMSHTLFAEFYFSRGGRPERELQLARFVEEYHGTEAALIAEVDRISQERTNILSEIANLRKFAADHPGTTAAAKALYQAGFQLGVNVGVTGIAPRGGDPTDRVLEVFELMKELQSGRYPNCEWVQRAPSLVLGVFASRPSYAAGNVDKLLSVYRTLLNGRLVLTDQADVDFAVGALKKMASLFELKIAPTAMDDVFAAMERNPAQASTVRYLKAIFYIELMNDQWRDNRPALLEKVTAALASVAKKGDAIDQRRALATLAALYFAERDFVRARDAYQRYARTYPESPWAWVASLRHGQSLDELGDPRAAVDVYRDVAARHLTHPVARTFGHAYAARTLESLTHFDDAMLEVRRALDAWDTDFGLTYSLSMGYPGMPSNLKADELRREQLELRMAQLRESLPTASGHLLERGRWLLERGKPTEALAPLEEVLRSAGESQMATEARLLIHRARLRRALDWVIATPGRDGSAALAELDLIARDKYDVGVFAAKVAKVSIMWGQRAVDASSPNASASETETLMREALSEWQSHQMSLASIPATPISGDLAAIRNLLFQSDGGEIYGAWARTRNERRPPSTAFVLVNPEVRVKFSDGAEAVHSDYDGLAGREGVLFLTEPQLSLLHDIYAKLDGGTSRVRTLWSRFFPVGNSMSGSLVLKSYPIITGIEYLDEGRTRAAARVVIGSEGCTVVLEKNDESIWKVIRLTDMWIA